MQKKLSHLLKSASVNLNFGKLKPKEKNIYIISEKGIRVVIIVEEERKPHLKLLVKES